MVQKSNHSPVLCIIYKAVRLARFFTPFACREVLCKHNIGHPGERNEFQYKCRRYKRINHVLAALMCHLSGKKNCVCVLRSPAHSQAGTFNGTSIQMDANNVRVTTLAGGLEVLRYKKSK